MSITPSNVPRPAVARSAHTALAVLLVVLAASASVTAGIGKLNFESPVATNAVTVTPDGSLILVVNPPNGTLSIIDAASRAILAEVPVGVQSVSVDVHPGGEFAYVANHVSDSLSVVDLGQRVVVATIQEVVPAGAPDAGRSRFDEPSMVLFSTAGDRAFVTLAQTNELAVIDTATHQVVDHIDFNGTLYTQRVIPQRVFLQTPREMARIGDDYLIVAGSAGSNRSQNNFNGGPPPPPTPDEIAAEIRVDHKCFQGSSVCVAPRLVGPGCGARCATEVTPRERWIANTSGPVVPDYVIIDLATLEALRIVQHAGSLLYGIASAPGDLPGTWRLQYAHTDAQNTLAGLENMQGRPWWNRMTEFVFEPPTGLTSFIKHDLDSPVQPLPTEPAAIPYAITTSPDGQTRYVTAAGSGRLLIVDADGAVQARLQVGAYPTSLALNTIRDELYVFNRVDGTLSVVDLSTPTPQVTANVSAGTDPLSAELRLGARVIHDATLSANGSFACASCHPAAESDLLVWELDPTAVEEAGPRLTPGLRGLAGTEGFHWDGRFASLSELVSETVASVLEGSVTPAEAAAAAAYLLSIPHLPSPTRAPADSLSDSAKEGLRTFFSHQSQGPLTCAAANCHAPPTWSSQTLHAGLETPSLRAVYDRKASLHDGIATNLTFINLYDNTYDLYDGIIDWEAALRSSLITELGEAFVPKHDDLLSWLAELSTGLPGLLGRQVTLTQASRQLPEVQELEAQLWQETDHRKVQLVARGLIRSTPASPWLALELVWDPSAQEFTGLPGTYSRLALEAAIDAGDATVSYTAELWTEGEDPIPELHAICEGCATPPIGSLPEWDPLQAHQLTLFGSGFASDLRLLIDGVPNNDPLTVISDSEAVVDFADMYCCCGELITFQVQNPNGRLSNELPLDNLPAPENDAGGDLFTCQGLPGMLGTPGLPGIDYSWSPAANLGTPLAAVTTAATPTPGVLVYTRDATVTGTACSNADEVTLTVLATGAPADPGNGYRVVKRLNDVEHIWAVVPGGSTVTLTASPDRQGSSPIQLAIEPIVNATWTETTGVAGASKYYGLEASPCQ